MRAIKFDRKLIEAILPEVPSTRGEMHDQFDQFENAAGETNRVLLIGYKMAEEDEPAPWVLMDRELFDKMYTYNTKRIEMDFTEFTAKS